MAGAKLPKIVLIMVDVILLVTFCYPVAILVIIISSPTDEYKEFVYVDGKEISRIDLYYLLPNVIAAAVPFFVMLILIALCRLMRKRRHN